MRSELTCLRGLSALHVISILPLEAFETPGLSLAMCLQQLQRGFYVELRKVKLKSFTTRKYSDRANQTGLLTCRPFLPTARPNQRVRLIDVSC